MLQMRRSTGIAYLSTSRLEAHTAKIVRCILNQEAITVSARAHTQNLSQRSREDLLIPPNSRSHSPQMPQSMRINHPTPGRKIKQLQTHSQNNPSNNQTRPSIPEPPRLPKPRDREPRPEDILRDAHEDVGGHIVCIIPMDESEVVDVH